MGCKPVLDQESKKLEPEFYQWGAGRWPSCWPFLALQVVLSYPKSYGYWGWCRNRWGGAHRGYPQGNHYLPSGLLFCLLSPLPLPLGFDVLSWPSLSLVIKVLELQNFPQAVIRCTPPLLSLNTVAEVIARWDDFTPTPYPHGPGVGQVVSADCCV